MRTTSLIAALVVVAALSACSDPVRPFADRQAVPGTARHDGGTYLGSGLSVGDPTITAANDTSSASRGPGYGGSGH